MDKFIYPHMGQMDGSKCEHTNCWATVGAYLVASATRGRVTPTPMEFREKANALRGCRPGGLGDIMLGLTKYKVKHTLLSGVSPRSLKLRFLNEKAEKVYAVPTDFEAWPEHEKCQPGYDGYHMVAVVPWRANGKDTKVMDPLCSHLKLVNADAVIRAANEYDNDHAGDPRWSPDVVVVDIQPRKD